MITSYLNFTLRWIRLGLPTVAIAVLLASSVVTISRGDDLSLTNFPKTLRYLKYKTGKIITDKQVRAGDSTYDALFSWLSEHRSGWSSDINSYAPDTYFTSADMQINCRDDVVVVNMKVSGGTRWTQLSTSRSDCRTLILGLPKSE